MSKSQKAILALIIANIIWGISTPMIKWTIQFVPFGTFLFLRMMIPAIFLFFLFPKKLTMRTHDFWINTIAVLIGITANFYIGVLALSKTASINGPIIGSSGPLFLMLGAVFFLHETPSRKALFGNFLAFLGICIIVIQPLLTHGAQGSSLTGNLLLLVATLVSVIGTLITKPLMKRISVPAVTFWSFFISGICFTPLLWQDIRTVGFLPHFGIQAAIGLAFGILLASALAYYLYFWALKYANAYEIGIFTYMDPVITLLVAAPLLHEYPSFLFLAGSTMVFLGIFIAEGRLHYHPIQKLLLSI